MHNRGMISYRNRRMLMSAVLLVFYIFVIIINNQQSLEPVNKTKSVINDTDSSLALEVLKSISIKGRAPKTDYSRDQFGNGWKVVAGCDTRNIILNRDMSEVVADGECNVLSGVLNDPYTGKLINFKRGSDSSSDVQIDHVVALSDAWQKGAQQLTAEKRAELANDPLELLAVDGSANMQKGDGDAATWLPSNKSFRCQYVARQIAIKYKYSLWMTLSEHDAILNILDKCPGQILPKP